MPPATPGKAAEKPDFQESAFAAPAVEKNPVGVRYIQRFFCARSR
jgi:hypothetical protein